MPETVATRTTVGRLVYAAMPRIDFGRLTADLDEALAGCDAGAVRMALERDGLALIDVGASRVGIALAAGLDRGGAAAVTVTVGHGPGPGGETTLARRQSVLARLIANRIALRFPPIESLWSETAEVATPGTFERIRDELIERRRIQAETQAEEARARRLLPRMGEEPGDLARMFAHLEATLDARRCGRAEPAAASGELGRSCAERPAPLLRAAAHLIDATLMVVALPVGVAMMVYSLSRGPDLNTSARALALSGTGLGLLHIAGSTAALRMLVL